MSLLPGGPDPWSGSLRSGPPGLWGRSTLCSASSPRPPQSVARTGTVCGWLSVPLLGKTSAFICLVLSTVAL